MITEQRRYLRTNTTGERSGLTLHWVHNHVLGVAFDESPDGLGIDVAHAAHLCVGQPILIHRLHEQRLRLARVRHAAESLGQPTRIGVQWVALPGEFSGVSAQAG